MAIPCRERRAYDFRNLPCRFSPTIPRPTTRHLSPNQVHDTESFLLGILLRQHLLLLLLNLSINLRTPRWLVPMCTCLIHTKKPPRISQPYSFKNDQKPKHNTDGANGRLKLTGAVGSSCANLSSALAFPLALGSSSFLDYTEPLANISYSSNPPPPALPLHPSRGGRVVRRAEFKNNITIPPSPIYSQSTAHPLHSPVSIQPSRWRLG